jgi:hypothetical protein
MTKMTYESVTDEFKKGFCVVCEGSGSLENVCKIVGF